mgnify:CR=1 FL=1
MLSEAFNILINNKKNLHNSEIKVDFGLVYGKDVEFLNKMKPSSVMLAEGSEITVEGKTKLKVNAT